MFKKRITSVIMAITLIASIGIGVSAAEENTISLQIGNQSMTVNGTEQSIDENGTAPIVENDRTMLPIRAIIEALGGTVEWNQEEQTVTIKQEISPNNIVTPKTSDDDYRFVLSENVNREHVFYNNRYGIKLAADLYTPVNLDSTQKYPAIVVGPPYGGVKEQSPGIYANQLAQRGFVVLAFDPAFMGESGGMPRNVSSPDIFTENFSAGVDYLGTLNYIDREKIGAIGICGSGGFAISAAQVDTRIKAVATASMYDISRASKDGMADTTLDTVSRQRWVDFQADSPEYLPSFPASPVDVIPDGLDPVSEEFFSYYGTTRGHHPNARGNFTTTSQMPFINYNLLDRINTVSDRPILFIAGENAHSLYFSEDAYKAAAEPKELYIVSDAIHIDLYDDVEKIPFDKLETFFSDAFNN